MNSEHSFFKKWISRLFTPTDRESVYLHKGEIVIVFIIGFAIAIALWILVNMNREYTVFIEVPLNVTEVDEEMAFSRKPPESIRVGLNGTGWNLIPLYRNPPEVTISVDQKRVNVADIIESHLASHTELVIFKISPQEVVVEMEPRVSKKVPVMPDLDIRLPSRHEILGGIRITPDSVTVTGARSVIDSIYYWPTSGARVEQGQGSVNLMVPLEVPHTIMDSSHDEVRVSFYVTEFTEGEARIPIRIRNVPANERIRLEPSFVTLRYDVSVDYYEEVQQGMPFEAFVEYNSIQADTTGRVVPIVRTTSSDLDIRIRTFQPRNISYFKRIEE
ncbi:hypothetical protein QLX67_01240 [Balneolaceae bacterium ANBcel3]|nr:hypothetical protein [Balneolaceae bacterium ANBcel3]